MARKWTLGVAVGAVVLAALAIGVVQTRADKGKGGTEGAREGRMGGRREIKLVYRRAA